MSLCLINRNEYGIIEKVGDKMGIIETQIKEAFDKFKQNGNLHELTRKLLCDADYSVRFAWQMSDVLDALKRQCPKPIFECVFYDGENDGNYHLFNFDPNLISRESLLIEVRSRLEHEIGVELDYVDKAMESVYLLNSNSLVKVVAE